MRRISITVQLPPPSGDDPEAAQNIQSYMDQYFGNTDMKVSWCTARAFCAELPIRGCYGRTPSELRRARRGASRAGESEVRLRLPFRAPLDWPRLLEYFALRATPGVEVVENETYARSIAIGDARGAVRVERLVGEDCLLARIRLDGVAPLIQVAERLRRIFDLGADPAEIVGHLRRDPALCARAESLPGVRVPGAWDGFELAVRAILGQQVSVRGATTLAGRLVTRYGERLPEAVLGVERLFPEPHVLAHARLASLGLPGARARAISSFARAVAKDELRIDASLGLERTLRAFRELPGIGDWTAQYVAMRALREPDAFPAGDLGLRKAMGSGAPMAEAKLRERSEAWRPWRAYAAVLLWTAPSESA